jgi:hypothetical protein
MKTSLAAKLRELLAAPGDRAGQYPDRSLYERFAIPHSFKPRLSFTEAVVSAGGAILRILSGSLLFAVWGTYALLAWNAIPNVFLRGVVLLALISSFAVALGFLMLAISALVRMVWPHRPTPKP